jgi:transposase
MDFDDMIPLNHVARVVNDAVDRLDDALFVDVYPGGGRPPYHPKLMAKILIYAYTQRIYSSRQIAKAVREQIPFLWLTGRQTPDFRTLNRFRGERMKAIVDEVFTGILTLLIEQGYVTLETYFLDGTKVEASANRYTYVWKKNVEGHKEKLEATIRELMKHIETVMQAENAEYGDRDLPEVDPQPLTAEALAAQLTQWEDRLRPQPVENEPVSPAPTAVSPPTASGPAPRITPPTRNDSAAVDTPGPSAAAEGDTPRPPGTPDLRKRAVQLVKKLRQESLPRLKKYEKQLKILGERNSFSKTDPDATFMRMKEDHLNKGQLKPAYNVQIGTENQFIVGFSVHQRPGDTLCLIPHLNHLQQQLGRLPQAIVADAGYGSEENYAYLEEHRRTAVVKFNTYRLEKTKKWKAQIKRVDNWTYDEAADEWICPADKRLTFIRDKEETTDSGYTVHLREYQAQDCPTCPLRDQCTKAAYRSISVSPKLLKYKQQVREQLASESGAALMKRRGMEVESVFGQIKENRRFRRFLLRGLEKVRTEWGILSIAHNLLKKTALQG